MTQRRRSQGFGFLPEESQHHFLVTIPASKSEQVYISEHFGWAGEEARELSLALGNPNDQMRVVLPRAKWNAIDGASEQEFNVRLKAMGLGAGKWKVGQTPLWRLFGKELVLLAWAIEDADPTLIPTAIENWLGLAPEERWWLFTMTNAATGHAIYGRNKGWRKAVRYALTENPVTGTSRPREDFLFFVQENGSLNED